MMIRTILVLLGTFTTALFAAGVITLEQNKSLFILCLCALIIISIDLTYEFYKLTKRDEVMKAVAIQYRFYSNGEWTPWFLCGEGTLNRLNKVIEDGQSYQTRTLGVIEVSSSSRTADSGG